MQKDPPNNLSRRSFLSTVAVTTTVLAGGSIIPSTVASVSDAGKYGSANTTFQKDFWWGAATAAYQIEGAVAEDGRKPSIWDTFSHLPGKTFNGDTGDVACDHYHHFENDVRLMAELGVKHYRFSISWSRVMLEGRGAVNERGMDFYRRLCDALHARNITPHATLYHWDLPQGLQDRYAGWQSREVVNDFGDYATAVVKRLGDRVAHWLTLNEIASFCYWNGYGVGKPGSHAPGVQLKTRQEQWQVIHNALLAHGQACLAIRSATPQKCSVGVAECFTSCVPVIETPEHIAAARKAFVSDKLNGGILMPLLTGRYNVPWLAAQKEDAPKFTEADMKLIGQPLDMLGFNCYTGSYIRSAQNELGYEIIPKYEAYPRMNINWLEIVPEAVYWGVRMVGEAAGKRKLPIMVTENGCPDGAKPDASGNVLDTDRIMYLRAYLRNAQRAVSEGYPLIGYFPWSLMDNFEWAEGYNKRFGLMFTDYQTQRRVPKLSYRWYQEVIRQHRIV
jgi:beta-glucosidase